ncbi:RHS domain-containing protein [Rhizobium sp. LEGMi135b]
MYVVCDHLGTPREMFNERGAKQWAAEYRLWGCSLRRKGREHRAK